MTSQHIATFAQLATRAYRRRRVSRTLLSMSNLQTRKSCVVPKCTNTTTKTPEKLFFHVPKDVQMRKKWIKAMKRLDTFRDKSTVYCCEDHFDIESDMENYVKYKLVGGRLKLKTGTVPHKFQCQQKTSAVRKRNKRKYFENMLSKDEEPIISTLEATKTPTDVHVASCEDEIVIGDPLGFENNDQYLELSKKSKGEQRKVKMRDKSVHKSIVTDKKCFKKEIKTISCPDTVHSRHETSSSPSTHEIYDLHKDSLNPDDDLDLDTDTTEIEKHFFRNCMQKAVLLTISKEPQLLLGLPKECYFLINLLSDTTKCTPRNIMMTLKKIRLHQPNAILALDFGLVTSSVTKILRSTVPVIASVLKYFVHFPASSNVQINLPIPFRKNYHRVQSIIDCFEIQIEKPVDAVRQGFTWSDHKSCNTIKYLISIRPDGLIHFISLGYGGKASESLILEDCGVLKTFPKRAALLAGEGFQNVALNANLLELNGHSLIRVPSVNGKVKPTKNEVLERKEIAALRIHAEGTIGRLRGFGVMSPRACVDLKEVELLDSVVTSACGIVNIQSILTQSA